MEENHILQHRVQRVSGSPASWRERKRSHSDKEHPDMHFIDTDVLDGVRKLYDPVEVIDVVHEYVKWVHGIAVPYDEKDRESILEILEKRTTGS